MIATRHTDGVTAAHASTLGECIEVRHHNVSAADLVHAFRSCERSLTACEMAVVEPEVVTLTRVPQAYLENPST